MMTSSVRGSALAFLRRCILIGSCLMLAACVSGDDPQADGPSVGAAKDWYASAASSEHADSARTHLFRRILHPGAAEFGSSAQARIVSQGGLPGLYNSVVDDEGRVFVLGGIGAFGDGAFIAALDATSLTPLWQTVLPGAGLEGSWNYPGAVGLHANGSLYAIHGFRLVRIDRQSGEVMAVTELPTPQSPIDVAYNGFIVLSDGVIAAKSYHRKPGCTEDGFRAVMVCGLEGTANSVIVLIEPESGEVLAEVEAPELVGGRISSTVLDEQEYIYAPGVDRLFRFPYANGKIAYDASWQPEPYRTGSQTPGTAATFIGEFAILQTNALATDTPLVLHAISQRDPSFRYSVTPFPDEGQSMIPSMPSVDPDLGRVYVVDGLARSIACFQFDPVNGFTEIWSDKQMSFGFSALIGSASERVLISSNALNATSFTDYTQAEIVWRNAATGKILLRSEPVGRIGGAVIGVGEDGVVYAPAPRESVLFAVTAIP